MVHAVESAHDIFSWVATTLDSVHRTQPQLKRAPSAKGVTLLRKGTERLLEEAPTPSSPQDKQREATEKAALAAAEREQCAVDSFFGIDEAKGVVARALEAELIARRSSAASKLESAKEKQLQWEADEKERINSAAASLVLAESKAHATYLKVFYAAASPQFVLDVAWPLRKGATDGFQSIASTKDKAMPALVATTAGSSASSTEQMPTKPKQPWQRVLSDAISKQKQQQQEQSTARTLFVTKATSRKDTAAAHLRRDRLRAHAQQRGHSGTSRCCTVDLREEEQSIRTAYCAAGWQPTQCVSVQEFLFQIVNTESVQCALRGTALYSLIKKRHWDTLYKLFDSSSSSNGLLTVEDIVQCAQQLLQNEHNVKAKFIRSAASTGPTVYNNCTKPVYVKGQAVEVLPYQGPKWYNAWITAVQPNSCYTVTYIKPDNEDHTNVLDSYNQSAESDEATYSFNTELTKAVAAVKLSHDSELDVSEANHLKIAVSDVAALNTKQQ
eukprot:4153-Heterococcus_DN1.PRE.2